MLAAGLDDQVSCWGWFRHMGSYGDSAPTVITPDDCFTKFERNRCAAARALERPRLRSGHESHPCPSPDRRMSRPTGKTKRGRRAILSLNSLRERTALASSSCGFSGSRRKRSRRLAEAKGNPRTCTRVGLGRRYPSPPARIWSRLRDRRSRSGALAASLPSFLPSTLS
jgi:hypothetical protein